MAINLGSAYGKVSIDSSGVAKGTSGAVGNLQNLSQIALQVGATLQNVGRNMTIGLTLPILAIGGASIKAASDLEESRNKVKVVFGDMSESVLKFGDDAAIALGQSKQQALEATSTFGNLFTSMGLGKEKSAELSIGLVQIASDLASFNNIDPQIVLEKLRSGLVGEVEPLRTLGINLTMAETKAKAMEMGLADANGELSQAALLQARYALIIEQSSNAQGDFARTSGGLANQTRILRAQLSDASAELGIKLLPIILKIVQALNTLIGWFIRLPEPVQNAILVLAGLVALAGPIVMFVGTIISLIGGVLQIVTVLGSLGISIGAIASAAATAAGALVGFGAVALSTLGAILLLAAGPAILYFAFKNNFMGITTTVTQLWFIIKHYFGLMLDWMSKAFTSIKWGEIGKFIIFGIANGLLMGIPSLILAAAKAAQAVLKTFDKELDNGSPSKQMFKRGNWSGQGFMGGLENSVKPNEVAKALARPVQGMSNSQMQNINLNFAEGLTVRQVQRMIDGNSEKLMRSLDRAMGGIA